MAARSQENKAGKAFRAQFAEYPEPFKHLDKDVAEIWRDVITCKPVEFWHRGNLILLEHFCTVAHRSRLAGVMLTLVGDVQQGLHVTQGSAELEAYLRYLSKLMLFADKLRFSPQVEINYDSDGARSEKGNNMSFLFPFHANDTDRDIKVAA